MTRALLVLAVAACGSPSPPPPPPAGSPEALAEYLRGVAVSDDAARAREVFGWQVDRTLWDHTVVPSYRSLYAGYQRAFAAEAPALVARLRRATAITARRHFAGDPRLTLAQARTRWALPVLFPSVVAEADGEPVDAVFVPDGTGWRMLLGVDAAMRAQVAALAPGCAALLDRAGPTGRDARCTDVGAAIADAALRTDRDQLARLCRLAETLCGKGLP